MLNYYCTWNAQNCARPDAVLEPSAEVFLGADGAKKARDYLDEDSIFGSGDLAGQFAPVFGSARRRAAKDSSAASGAARRAPNTGVPACAGAARPGSAIGRSTGAAGSLTRSGGSCWRN